MKSSLYKSLFAAATLLTISIATDAGAVFAQDGVKIARSNVSNNRSINIFSDIATEDNQTEMVTGSAKSSKKSTAIDSVPTSSIETNNQPKSTESTLESKSRKSSSTTAKSGSEDGKSKVRKQRKTEIAINLIDPEIKPNQNSVKIEVKKAKKIVMRSPSPYSGNHLRLVRYGDEGTNELGNPLYTLEAYVDGELRQTIRAISGTAYTQTRDRHVGNNAAPLPDGIYSVSDTIVPGSIAEVGRTFIALTPKFDTGRTDLGIHLDPSYNQRNGRDGTAGCVGITNSQDRDAINEFVEKYRPRNLYVKISK
jgi:hypothetical protein